MIASAAVEKWRSSCAAFTFANPFHSLLRLLARGFFYLWRTAAAKHAFSDQH